jgi:DtxR family Mn-dependent transcriptional regulator
MTIKLQSKTVKVSDHSQAVQDYLKAIYELTRESGRATTTDLSELMGVRPASATGMVQKLAGTDPPLLHYEKHRGVSLTPEGEKVALEIIRHHRLLEMFLHKTLGFGWDEVHDEADRLEHVISEDFEERIAQALGNPSHDPHGHPIPTRKLDVPPRSVTRLSDLRSGQKAIIKRVDDADPSLLRHLSDLGLEPEAQIEVIDYSHFDDNLCVKVKGAQDALVLGTRITSKVFVQEQSS